MELLLLVAGATLLANIGTVALVYGFYLVSHQERDGREPGFVGLGLIAMPLLFVIGVLYLNGALEATPLRHLSQPEKPAQTQSPQYPGTP